ncbi:DUF5753 domain-containing protein [Streptomyces phaeochromogenes]|uniref:DUF5753 domain-containing protein n=1 Tax=Streptomyces phaeochromogenes TaxID=1923 RepID=UPI003682B532
MIKGWVVRAIGMRSPFRGARKRSGDGGQFAPHVLAPIAESGQRLPAPKVRARPDQREPPPLLRLAELDYTRAIFSNRVPELTDDERELRVSHRLARRVIIEGLSLIPYKLLIHEAALRIKVGDRATSKAQISRLLDLSEADHISVRVIPFDLEGFARAGSTMTYVGGPVSKLDTVVRDVPHGSAFTDSEAMLSVFRTRFHKIEEVALSPDRSRDFIHRLAKEL